MGVISTQYFTGDHLGSTSVLTGSTGAVSERASYDAFGKRRNANGTDNTACSITSQTTRGYTAQEMMDSVCEINMNARIYDPTIGRFMSADSMVPNPMDGQSFNRFSYVENNPLNATDPTGHSSSPFCPTNECFEIDAGLSPSGPPGGMSGGITGPGTGGLGGDNTSSKETVIVNGHRNKSPSLWVPIANPVVSVSFIFSPAEAAERNNKNNDTKGTCNQAAMSLGNTFRTAAYDVSVIGSAVTLSGLAIAAGGAPESAGSSAAPGAVVVGGGISMVAVGGYIDIFGATLQSLAQEAPTQDLGDDLLNAGMDSTTKQIVNPEIGTAYDLARGMQTMAGGPPPPQSCK